MIIKDKEGTVTIFYSNPRRQIILSVEEYEELENLIRNPPPLVEIKNHSPMWSPGEGASGCKSLKKV